MAKCSMCDRPMATDADMDNDCDGGCTCDHCRSLCWREFGGQCYSVDWRTLCEEARTALARAEAERDADRDQYARTLDEAIAERNTLRRALDAARGAVAEIERVEADAMRRYQQVAHVDDVSSYQSGYLSGVREALRVLRRAPAPPAEGAIKMLRLAREADANEADLRRYEECVHCGHTREEHTGSACRLLCTRADGRTLHCGCTTFRGYDDEPAATAGEACPDCKRGCGPWVCGGVRCGKNRPAEGEGGE